MEGARAEGTSSSSLLLLTSTYPRAGGTKEFGQHGRYPTQGLEAVFLPEFPPLVLHDVPLPGLPALE